MQKIIVGAGVRANTRLDEFIKGEFPNLPHSALHRAFRKKDIKVDGRWAPTNALISPGNSICIFLNNGILYGSEPQIVFENSNILIVNKPQGMPVHPDSTSSGATLIEFVRSYLGYVSRDGSDSVCDKSRGRGSMADLDPALCHRLDRNTGGLVIVAKNKRSLDFMLEKMKSGEIRKFYLCVVHGKPSPSECLLEGWLTKNDSHNVVRIHDFECPGAQKAVTRYKLLMYSEAHNANNIAYYTGKSADNVGRVTFSGGKTVVRLNNLPDICSLQPDTSMLEVEILTGRTHQIRAHLAHIGHPIIGDGKYCPNSINKLYGAKIQRLWAYKLEFDFYI
ncbi:MAG: RluA family pseudouridine synthase [Oscillospiraceae bacterium]|nr:RluA family pseudouridine synthase [Oscillospiraceae bacterium]